MKPFVLDILSPNEIPSLLALQKANLKSNITVEEATLQGFLTFPYAQEEVLRMVQDMSQPIAKINDQIVAYALAASKEACLETALLKPAIELSDTIAFNGKRLIDQRYYMMGQICIEENFRGFGIFADLYEMHKILYSKDYDCVVTEISTSNFRSMAAHKRVGFEIIHHYSDAETDWQLVAWNWR